MRIASALMVVALLLGCEPRVRPPIEGRLDPYGPRQITFAQDDLREQTAVGTPSATRDENDILYVTVPIRATSSKQLHVDYRVTFFDRNGQTLSQSAWMTKVLAPNVPDQVQVNSMSPRADGFQVAFRWAR